MTWREAELFEKELEQSAHAKLLRSVSAANQEKEAELRDRQERIEQAELQARTAEQDLESNWDTVREAHSVAGQMMAEAKQAELRVQQQILEEKENQQAHVQSAELARQSLHAQVETLRATLTTNDTRAVPRRSSAQSTVKGTPRVSDAHETLQTSAQATQQVSNARGAQRISDAQGVQRVGNAQGTRQISDALGAHRASEALVHAEKIQFCEDTAALRGLLLAARQEADQERSHSQKATERLEELEMQFQASIERAERVLQPSEKGGPEQSSDIDQLRREVQVMRGELASLQHDVLLAGLEARAARAVAAAAAAAAPGPASASPPPTDGCSGYTATSLEQETRLRCSQKLAEKREALARWEQALNIREQALEEQWRPAIDQIIPPMAASFSRNSTVSTSGGSGVPPMWQSAVWGAQQLRPTGWLGRLTAGCRTRRRSAQPRAW